MRLVEALVSFLSQTAEKSLAATAVFAMSVTAASPARAQVPVDIAAKLRQIGTGVCVPETATLYKPLQPSEPYPGVILKRDIPYAEDP